MCSVFAITNAKNNQLFAGGLQKQKLILFGLYTEVLKVFAK